MDAVEAVTIFIRRIVSKEKQERYVGFVTGKNGRKKFLDALDHSLEKEIDISMAVKNLDDKEWIQPGFLYSSNGTFGTELNNLKDGYDKASPYGGWLILSQSAGIAIFRPEGKIDDEIFFKF
jgi:hypothetical protein